MHYVRVTRLVLRVAIGLASLGCGHAQITQGPPPPPPTFFLQFQLQDPQFNSDLDFERAVISADGKTMVVTDTSASGKIYENHAGAWTQVAQLSGDVFALAAAISADGSTIVFGVPAADPPSNCTTVGDIPGGGAAYIFVRPAGGWVSTSNYTAKLTNSDGVESDGLGTSVDISGDGNTVVLGAPKFRPNVLGCNGSLLPTSPGSAYLYLKPAGGWGVPNQHQFEDAELTSSDGAANDAFGEEVVLSADGHRIVASTPFRNSDQGEAYVFDEPNDPLGWAANSRPTETSRLLAADGSAGDFFGHSVAISQNGSSIVVGAPEQNTLQGKAYIFVEPTEGWSSISQTSQAGTFASATGSSCDQFGTAVAVSGDGNTVIVSAPYEHATSQGFSCSLLTAVGGFGDIYVFTKPLSGWPTLSSVPATKLSQNQVTNGLLGYRVSTTSSSKLLVATEPFAQRVFVFAQGPLAALSSSTLSFSSQPIGTTSSPQTITMTNNGSEPMSISVEGLDPGFHFQGGTPACLGASPLAPGASCTEYLTFAPMSIGPITGSLSFQDNSGNVSGTQQTVALSGTGIRAGTMTTITFVSPSPTVVGQPVTVGFEVAPSPSNPLNPSGNVTVSASTAESCIGLAVIDNCMLKFTSYGARTITATYAGDTNFTGSNSSQVTLNVGDFSISAAPTAITIPIGGSGSSQVTIGSLGGFNSAVNLAIAGALPGVSASVSPSLVTPPSGGSTSPSTVTVTLGPSITPTTFTLTSSGAYGSLTHSVPITVTAVATPGSTTNVTNQLLSAGCINSSGVANAFTNKLSAAQSAINAGNTQLGVNILDALLYQLQAQSGKHLATSCTISGVTFNSAAVLIGDVKGMLASLKLLPNPIIGYVANSSGMPVSGAKVSIVNSTGTIIANSTSDVAGFYFFPNTAGLVTGTTYTAKIISFPSLYKSSTPASQTFTWQGALVVLNNFTVAP